MKDIDIPKIVQTALLGAVPPTLRFLYSGFDEGVFFYEAVFTEDAPEEHIECAQEVLTEIYAAFPTSLPERVSITKSNSEPWKRYNGKHLLFLRYGELDVI